MSRRGLQLALVILGTVGTTFGALGVAQGGSGVRGGGKVSANVDSELRFFAAWYAIFGVLMLRAARRPESEVTIVRAAGVGCLLAASGRILSMKASGPPSTIFKVLMGIEFAIPAVILPWHTAVWRRYAPALGPAVASRA
jgi:Domain of unknown function (DUF4345)